MRRPAAEAAAERRRRVLEHRRRERAEAGRRRDWPIWIYLPRVEIAVERTPSGCGCGRA